MADTHVGKQVAILRKQLGMTQEELARIAIVHSSTIARLEQGRTRLPRETELARIAKALGVTVERLFQAGADGEDPPGVEMDAQTIELRRLQIMADYLIDSGRTDSRDIPIITATFARLVDTINANREYERRNRQQDK